MVELVQRLNALKEQQRLNRKLDQTIASFRPDPDPFDEQPLWPIPLKGRGVDHSRGRECMPQTACQPSTYAEPHYIPPTWSVPERLVAGSCCNLRVKVHCETIARHPPVPMFLCGRGFPVTPERRWRAGSGWLAIAKTIEQNRDKRIYGSSLYGIMSRFLNRSIQRDTEGFEESLLRKECVFRRWQTNGEKGFLIHHPPSITEFFFSFEGLLKSNNWVITY